ncbi:LysR family transcriptional regulator [Solemya velesiana gill symbiont]
MTYEAFRLSQPAHSIQVKRLEEQIEIPLFLKTGK